MTFSTSDAPLFLVYRQDNPREEGPREGPRQRVKPLCHRMGE